MVRPIKFNGDYQHTAYINDGKVRITQSCSDGNVKSFWFNQKERQFDIESGKYYDVITMSIEQFREMADYLEENSEVESEDDERDYDAERKDAVIDSK